MPTDADPSSPINTTALAQRGTLSVRDAVQPTDRRRPARHPLCRARPAEHGAAAQCRFRRMDRDGFRALQTGSSVAEDVKVAFPSKKTGNDRFGGSGQPDSDI